MTVESHELALYTINSGELYHRQGQPIIANLKRKIAKGVYDPELALKAWYRLASSGAYDYCREFGGSAYSMFGVQDRREAAKELAEHYADHLADPS